MILMTPSAICGASYLVMWVPCNNIQKVAQYSITLRSSCESDGSVHLIQVAYVMQCSVCKWSQQTLGGKGVLSTLIHCNSVNLTPINYEQDQAILSRWLLPVRSWQYNESIENRKTHRGIGTGLIIRENKATECWGAGASARSCEICLKLVNTWARVDLKWDNTI